MTILNGTLRGWRSRLLTGIAAIAGVAAVAAGGHHSALAAGKGLIVVFMPPGTDNYLAQWQKGARAKAAELGYDIKIIESSRDQAEQDSQVQQEIASGEKVDGYIWWPYVNAAGTGSLRALSKTGVPVVFTNQYPIPGTDKFWTAYAGVNDFLNAETAAKALLKACAESHDGQVRQGPDLHLPGRLFGRFGPRQGLHEGGCRQADRHSAGSCRLHGAGRLQDGLAVHSRAEGRDHLGLYGERQRRRRRDPGAQGERAAPGQRRSGRRRHLPRRHQQPAVRRVIGSGIQAAFLEGW